MTKQSEQKIKILDCTIRDGGHLNKWRFDPLCVRASYYAALKSGVDYFEVGYRYPRTMKDLGDFGYCEDAFLAELLHPSKKCTLTVMIDAGKCSSGQFPQCTPQQTPIRAVRVAAYPFELTKAIGIVQDLHGKGYEVFLNLMAASELTESEYELLRAWDQKDILEAINFADSFGSFVPDDIPRFMEHLRAVGFKRIGFHPHNNLQMAFANTLSAIQAGAVCVDASIYGMGRGSGNLPIEVLIGYFEKCGFKRFNTPPYLDVIERYYEDLFRQYDWGYKIKSLLGGLKNIHPYYVDDLFGRRNYTVDEIWNALDAIKEKCPISYSPAKLNETLDSRFYKPLNEESARVVCQEVQDQFKILPASDAFRVGGFPLLDKHRGKRFIIVANGPSLMTYKNEIQNLITEEGCVTIGVNYLQNAVIPDYHLFLSRKRFLKYVQFVNKQSVLLIPSFFGRTIIDENYEGNRYYFDVDTVSDGSIPPVVGTTQKCCNLNVAVSSILCAYLMGASEILAIGMDGYVNELNKKMVYFYNENDTPDNKEVASYRYTMLAEELERVNLFLQDKSVPFAIITPTTHVKYYRKMFS